MYLAEDSDIILATSQSKPNPLIDRQTDRFSVCDCKLNITYIASPSDHCRLFPLSPFENYHHQADQLTSLQHYLQKYICT